MRRFFLLLFLCSVSPAFSQSHPDAKALQVAWEVIENNHQNKSQFLSAFTITNTAKTALPAKGWTLYFNFIRTIQPASVTGHVAMSRVNGDLFKMTPTASFSGIAPGASLRVEFASSDWVVNLTDAPLGLYLVWDEQPAKGYTLGAYEVKPSTQPRQYMRSADDKVGLITPQIVYAQNKSIVDIPAAALPKIFPTPVSYRETGGTFLLTDKTQIVADAAFQQEADYLAAELATLLGKKLVVTIGVSTTTKQNIVLTRNTLPEEAYRLAVTETGATLSASSGAGIFYAIQSLRSLIPPAAWAKAQPSIAIPTVEVDDAPRFGYRSMFLDAARNFHNKAQILRLLDVMAFYKMNTFHFHLIDDEGWRLEIPSLPELTQFGSKRGHTADEKDRMFPSFASGPDVSYPGSGYYTRADYIEILKYANARHIRVIPEVETPGHARAAVKSMDRRYERLLKEGQKEEAEKYLLHLADDSSEFRSVQGWTDNVMDVSLPSVYTFLSTVTDEILAMYKEAGAPISTIHFGGDEVPAGVWEKSPAYLALKEKNTAIQSTDDLWYYYYGKVNDIVKARGLYLYGWEEIALRKTLRDGNKVMIVNPDFVADHFQVDVWNNVLGWGAEDLAYRLANSGYKVVLSCVSNLYMDMAYQKAFEEPGYYWGTFADVDKPFYFIPYDYFKNAKEDKFGNPLDRSIFVGKERLTDYGKNNIVGVQGLIWSENMINPGRFDYQLLPKLLGVVERAWAKDPDWATEKDARKSDELYQKAWSTFVNVLAKRELPRMDYYGGGFAYRIPTAGAMVADGKVLMNVQLPGMAIRYTTDGKEPTVKSKLYSGPVADKGTIKMKVFNGKGRSGRTAEIVNP